ncbi:tripartite tricarboxylate transporter substrate binding protein [Achromobacter sp. GG226]|uniref:Bug family tripartite tricarboxylate transporter substrate binding protein n=1 Tax=Verticiella alkaliphila TaxID=2779529 RepID=UPI001C0C28C2|nr:tripartite tricarboxylate transporter substrate-binding protein [Verticiella sp. GG226]MBU4612154.1 tripartite tricarboxylate transporter substrate binding protein [Verticiella sp. GG226]
MQAPLRRAATALCLSLGLAGTALAVDYPTRPINIIVPFGPGSGVDATARVIGEALGRELGQALVIENKAGAQGAIAAQAAARAPADGYSLFFTTQTTQAANPALMKHLTYDPIKDFAPIARVAYTPALLVANNALPVKSVKELIDLAKQKPGKISYASGSAGTLVPGAMLAHAGGVDMLHIPYKSIPQGLSDVMGGHVDVMFTDIVTGLQQVRAGSVRALGISSQTPWRTLPDVPPIAATFPGFELLAWYALYAPTGTPEDVIARINAAMQKVSVDPQVRERLDGLGLEVAFSTPQELDAFGRSELAKWRQVIEAAGIQPE